MSALVLSPLARQIAALGLALCAVALSLAYPLRSYIQQQAAEQAAVAEQQQLEEQIADLREQKAALKDPAYIKAEAKRRLQYVSPGDTVYVIKVPKRHDTDGTGTNGSALPGGSGSGGDVNGDEAGGGAVAGDEAGGVTNPSGESGSDGGEPWYASLWGTLSGQDDSAVTPAR